MEWKHETLPYFISDNKEQLELEKIYALLQTSYWANNRSREMIERSIEGSFCFGIYHDTGQVGLMRIVTDFTTFSWICDVIIDPDHRGQGLGKWLMQFLLQHPALSTTQMALGTKDAHSLYEQYGFVRKELMHRRAT